MSDSNIGSQMLSEVVFYRTYAKTLENGKKETFEETVERVENMHMKKFPSLAIEIHHYFQKVFEKKVVPSMRSMQFAGRSVELSNCRMYNCSFTAIESHRDISDILYLLCCGVGCGYSVQRRHITNLPVVSEGKQEVFVVPDTKEGWAESVYRLLSNPIVTCSYEEIRPRGMPLSTGGTASGPDTLQLMHHQVREVLKKAVGRKLRPLEVHDVICQISDLVVCGGSRRSALISLFDVDEEEMMNCKAGFTWFNTHPWRARANNSAVLLRTSPSFAQDLERVVRGCFANGTGEPGIFLTNDPDYGTNPCCEISLRSKQMCNLTEVNVHTCSSGQDFLDAVASATVIGTLQASYTDFPYIQTAWAENCQKDALLGVSITGTAQNWELLSQPGLLDEAATVAKRVNREWAAKLGINPAARIGCVKPSGTTSALLGTTSGIHAAHANYYLRRVRIETNSPLCSYLLSVMNVNNGIINKLMEDQRKQQDEEKGAGEESISPSTATSPSSSSSYSASSKISASLLQVLTKHPLVPNTVPLDTLAHMADSSIAATGLPILETDAYARKSAEAANNYAVTSLVLTMPISMEGAILRSEESPVELLDRAAFVHKHFIQSSHNSGPNFHNVSLTVNYKAQRDEEESILQWLLMNTDCYAGVSMFPEVGDGDGDEEEKEAVSTTVIAKEGADSTGKPKKKKNSSSKAKGGKVRKTPRYPQMPFEEVDEDVYEQWLAAWNSLGLMAREQMLRDMLGVKAGAQEEEGKRREKESETVGGVVEEASTPVATNKQSAERRRRLAVDVAEREAQEEKQRILEFLTSDRFMVTSPTPPIPGVHTPLSTVQYSSRVGMLSLSPGPASSSSSSQASSSSYSSYPSLLPSVSTPVKSRSPSTSPSPSPASSPCVHASVEDSFKVIQMGLSKVLWDPKAKDTRKQTLACAGGNCEYV